MNTINPDLLNDIAKSFGFTTTETTRSGDDFREVAIWSVVAAIEKAYAAGRDDAHNSLQSSNQNNPTK